MGCIKSTTRSVAPDPESVPLEPKDSAPAARSLQKAEGFGSAALAFESVVPPVATVAAPERSAPGDGKAAAKTAVARAAEEAAAGEEELLEEPEEDWPEDAKVRIVCIGNPGSGKSTLLNSLIGRPVFESGFSAGKGLTEASTSYWHKNRVYIDTPGLADSQRRPQAAAAIADALKEGALYNVIFVITLEAWHVRPEDKATMELVLESLKAANIKGKYGVVINKNSAKDLAEPSSEAKEQLKAELFRGIAPTRHIGWLEEVPDIMDKAQQVIPLTDDFLGFIAKLRKVNIKTSDVADIKYNKFEELRTRLEGDLRALNDKNSEVRLRIEGLLEQQACKGTGTIALPRWGALPAPGPQGDGAAAFAEGEELVVLSEFVPIPVDDQDGVVLSVGQRGTVKTFGDDDAGVEKVAVVQFAGLGPTVAVHQPDFGKLCRARDVEVIKRNKVRELASRGIELGVLLDFYGRLGGELMPDFQPDKSITFEVVRDAVLPVTKEAGLSYSEYAQQGPRLAMRMVSHNWANRFAHLVAAIVADAMDLPTYEEVVAWLAPESLESLKSELKKMGKLSIVYWICALSVNQHQSICKGIGCDCETVMRLNSSPECEMDKFDDMMGYLFDPALNANREDEQVSRHVVAVDREGILFSRAWVIAELVTALLLDCDLIQKYKVFSEQSLQNLRDSKGNISIWECQASNKADEDMVKDRARLLIEKRGGTSEELHEQLNSRIYAVLADTQAAIERTRRPHVLVIGNAGVGKTTLINLMMGDAAAFAGSAKPGALCEQEHDGVVFMEAPGLTDTRLRRRAARAATTALKKDGRYKIFFVVTLEAGRVRLQAKEMMSLVLSAAPIGSSYSVVVNKATREAVQAFGDETKLAAIKSELFRGLKPPLAPSSNIQWVLKCADDGTIRLPDGLLETAPSLYIEKSRVRDVNGETDEEVAQRLKAQKAQLEKDNAYLESKLLKIQTEINSCSKYDGDYTVQITWNGACNLAIRGQVARVTWADGLGSAGLIDWGEDQRTCVIKWHKKNATSEWAQIHTGRAHLAENGLDEEFRIEFLGDDATAGFKGEFQREYEGPLSCSGRPTGSGQRDRDDAGRSIC